MARKLKLTPGSAPDYTVIGISCHLKDYRMVFLANRKLRFQFRRTEDLVIEEGGSVKDYSFYIYDNRDERTTYFLVQNHHPEGRLVPSLKGVDYFIIAGDMLDATSVTLMAARLQEIPQVLSSFKIDLDKVKNLDVILEEIELHMLEQKRFARQKL